MTTSITRTEEATFLTKDVVAQTGATEYLLRTWEQRYGWPSPRRKPNGYRAFTQSDIDDIKRVVALVHDGKKIGSLIVDRRPVLPE